MDTLPELPEDYPLQSVESSKAIGAILRDYAEKLESGELRILRGVTHMKHDTTEFGAARIIIGTRIHADLYLVRCGV